MMYVTMLAHDKLSINVGYFYECQECQEVRSVVLCVFVDLSESKDTYPLKSREKRWLDNS